MRLLIVEDDAPLASGLQRILEAEGHAVDVTARGEEAVIAASQEKFDLVILDIGLPQMDGFEVLRRLRAGAGPMPVLVLTARDAVDDRVRRSEERRVGKESPVLCKISVVAVSLDRKSTRLNSSHPVLSRMPSSA